LIIEVLSPSTSQRNREFKRLIYQQLPNLQEYLLVAQHSQQVMVYRRLPNGWEQETYSADEAIKLNSIGLDLPPSQIYADISR
jgi:Uma2 family endonuclease